MSNLPTAYANKGQSFEMFQGKLKWPKLDRVNDWGKWTVVLYPDAKALERIRELQAEGVKNVIKKDDDGYYTTLSRPNTKLIRGKVVAFDPVKIVDKDIQPFIGSLGNGTDATVKVEIYSHPTPGGGKAKAMRLESIRIDNLVPYNPEVQFTPTEKSAVQGLSDQPEQLF